jgi:hypothetical protein
MCFVGYTMFEPSDERKQRFDISQVLAGQSFFRIQQPKIPKQTEVDESYS